MNHIQNGCNRILDMLIIASEKRILRIIKLLTPDTRFKRPIKSIITSKLSSSAIHFERIFFIASHDSDHSQIHLKMETFCIFSSALSLFLFGARWMQKYFVYFQRIDTFYWIYARDNIWKHSPNRRLFLGPLRSCCQFSSSSFPWSSPFSFSVQFFEHSRCMHRSIVVLLYSFFVRMVESGFKPFHENDRKRL